MAITRTFMGEASLRHLVVVLNSVGAHVAAKLSMFGTDERTLTDEVCDMFFIWAQENRLSGLPIPKTEEDFVNALPEDLLQVTISKQSQQEEAAIGADLGLKLTSPRGVKRALVQAKVFDPTDNRLRCDSPSGWDKLWSQLVLMRQRSHLAFLLVYIPADKLDGQLQGLPTWEQGSKLEHTSKRSSKLGATLIPVEQVLDQANNWRHAPPVQHRADGQLKPSGISLGRLLVEMALCDRGAWLPAASFPPDGSGPIPLESREGFPVHYRPYREIAISIDRLGQETWDELVDNLRARLEDLALQ